MEIDSFYLIGVNYKKTDVCARSKFAISDAQYENLIAEAKSLDLDNIFVLATCNRTEIYGVVPDPNILSNLLCSQTEGDITDFQEMSYSMQGREAATHLFSVAAGLDSQILGDYEILGQLKQSVKIAKKNQLIGNFLERLTNTSYQASKEIKNKTELSGGTISVSFAAIQFLKWHVTDFSNKNILLIGTGSIGTSTIKNVVDYLHTNNITVINRTHKKAQAIADEHNLRVADYSNLKAEIKDADIIITATGSKTPLVELSDIQHKESVILIDLSVPNNIHTNVKTHPGAILVNVDDLSKISTSTYANRAAQVPKAMAIIEEHLNEFSEWHAMRKHVPVIRAAQKTLEELNHWALSSDLITECPYKEQAMKKAIQNMAVNMKAAPKEPRKACNYFQAITDYFNISEHE